MFSSSRQTLVRNVIVGLVAGAALGGAGIASASVLSKSATPSADQVEQGVPGGYNDGQTRAGTSLSAGEATDAVLNGLEGSPVDSVKVIDSPDPGYPIEGPWVSTQVDAASVPSKDAGGTVEAVWLGGLAQGAVADLMRNEEQTTSGVIAGGQVALTGQNYITRIGTGSIIGGQAFNSPSDAVLKERVERAAEKFGLDVKSVEILHPLESAISVTFVVPDEMKMRDWYIEDLREAIDGDPKNVEGSLIRLVSPSGEPLLTAGGAYRIGSGGLWFAPGQDDRFGAGHGGSLPGR